MPSCTTSQGSGIGTGFTFQISSQYWRIVRSDEKKPQRAVLRMDIRVHLSGSR